MTKKKAQRKARTTEEPPPIYKEDVQELIAEIFRQAIEGNESAKRTLCSILAQSAMFAGAASRLSKDCEYSREVALSACSLCRSLEEVVADDKKRPHVLDIAKNTSRWPVMAHKGRGSRKVLDQLDKLPLAENLPLNEKVPAFDPGSEFDQFLEVALMGFLLLPTIGEVWIFEVRRNFRTHPLDSEKAVNEWTDYIVSMLDEYMGSEVWTREEFKTRFPILGWRTAVTWPEAEDSPRGMRGIFRRELKRKLRKRAQRH